MRKKLTLQISSIVLIILAIVLFFAFKSGAFEKAPAVEITADNCYEETITVVMGDSFAPFSFKADNGGAESGPGSYSGHDVELANELGNRLHMNVKQEYYDWSTCLEKVQTGQADMIMSVDYELPMDGISYSVPTATNPWVAFIREGTQEIRNLADLFGKSIGIGEGTDPFAGSDFSDNYVVFESYDEAFKALNEGSVDTVITQYQVGMFIIKTRGYKGIKADSEIAGGHLAIGFREDRKDILAEVDKIIADMSRDGTLDRLNAKWLGTFVKTYSLREMWTSNPEYFIIAGILIFVVLLMLALLIVESGMQKKETKLREQIQTQSELIKQLIKEYSDVYFIRMQSDKNNDTAELLFKGEVFTDDIPEPDENLPFTKKLDYFIENIVCPEDRLRVYGLTRREIITSVINKGDVYAVEFKAMREGEPHNYQMRFARVGDSENPVGMVIGLRLIDEEVKFREQLAASKATAEEANRAKTAFLFNMSHDIRTPMNAIVGFTNMAVKHIDDKEKVVDCLGKTQKAGTMLLSLINNVLEVSRIESGHATLDEQPGDVYLSFVNIESTMQELAATKDINLTFTFGDIKDRYVFADFSRCMRIFVNIISNAIKYTREGGFVKVSCSQEGEAENGTATFRYTFTDNGIGMSEEFQQHVFDQFAREKSSTISGIQGTGLGMSVVKSFVDLLGGQISVNSRQGEGTTFTVLLPFKVQDEATFTDPESGEVVSPGAGGETRTAEITFIGKNALLVEDNDLNREIATEILEDEGIVVESADDGTTAVEKMKERGPEFYDFILMDIQMPQMNGYEATKAIREMYPEYHIPIIALSANAFEEDKKKSLEAGMDDHVAKPVNIPELKETLAKYL